MYARRTRSFSQAECDPVTVLVCINLILIRRKSCGVHMTMFEIVVHQLVYTHVHDISGADNS